MAWKKSARVSPDEFEQGSSNEHYDAEKGHHKMSELGPVKKRKCRDVVFLVLFLLYWVGMFIVAASAAQNGDLTRLTLVTDSSGNTCGVNNTAQNSTLPDYSTKPFLYFLDPIGMLSTSKSVCIASCPSTTTVSTYQTTACIPGVTATLTTYAQLVLAGNCSAYNYQATPVLSVCVPDISAITNEMIKASASSNKTTADLSPSSVFNSAVSAPIQVVSDLQKTWPVLAVSAAGALIVAFLWLFLIQWFGSIFIWLVIAAFNVILIAASVWLYFYWQSMIVKANSSALGVENMEVTGAVIAFGIVAAIAFIFLLITLALLKKISLAIQIIKEATQAVRAMPLIVFFPLWCWAAIVSFTVYFLLILALLVTPKMPITVPVLNQSFSDPNISYAMIGYHLFGYLWAFWLFLGINQVSLAGAYATWYWTMDKHSLPHFPVMRSFYRTLRYHLGSVAIGSLMLAIVSFLQIVLMVLRRFRAAKNPVVQWIICCFLCCLKCVQYILKFINKNAYIKIAISGEAFCKSASSALALLVKNALRLAAVDLVSGFLLLVSKLGIAALVAFIAYLYVGANSTTLQLNFPLLTVILSGLVALLIAIAFLGVFQMAIDTIFLCFLDDCDKNDGSPERPFYMSDNLKSIVNKANQLAPQASRVKMSKSIDEF